MNEDLVREVIRGLEDWGPRDPLPLKKAIKKTNGEGGMDADDPSAGTSHWEHSDAGRAEACVSHEHRRICA